ncbi:uncharacterized protein LOC113769223 [Coffea eugenioides]|uniref:uncharacterized protein LOC113769223 n=1 Tax=Coffea eugenioides TaxID=49369 RepID=UPI000F608F91|nr:uncharacterized protein LOC113769223 [Coffea eugenioides]
MIKAMFWNVRGVDNALTIARLRKLKRMHQVSLLAMCEPKAGRERLDFIRNRLGFRHAISNDESRIWVMYGQDYRCDLLVASHQFLALEVTHAIFRCSVVAVFVHASCASLDREALWQQLGEVCPQGMPAIFLGDFNVIVGANEKKGGRPFRARESEPFLSFMEGAELTDLGFSGSQFTWCNNRWGRAMVWKCLDRVLVNQDWLSLGVNTTVAHLNRVASDHSPLLLSCSLAMGGAPKSFRFLDVWRSHADFHNVVRQAWKEECDGRPIRVLLAKLKAVKQALRTWNKETFCNIFDRVKEDEATVLALERSLEECPSGEGEFQLLRAQGALKMSLLREAAYWRQKARLRWLREGDANSKFFHAQVKQRRARSFIHRMKDTNGVWTEEPSRIEEMATTFFADILSQPGHGPMDLSMLEVIPSVITVQDNMELQQFPTEEEVKAVVFQLDGGSSPGPDGFT